MRTYSLSHVGDRELLHDLASLVARDRAATAALLAHLAEVDARRLYLPAAYASMYAYCVNELHLSEDAACKRITVARVARQFPAIFQALADGRLHLSGIVLLAPYLTPQNGDELLGVAARRTKAEIEELLARRFPRSETMGLVQALPVSAPPTDELSAPGRIEAPGPECAAAFPGQHAPAHVGPRSRVTPVAPDRYLLQLTIGRDTQDKLRRAQELLGHGLPSGDIAQVLDRALDALIEKLERTKTAATTRPRRSASQRPSANPRHIPAHVKRTVWEREEARRVAESRRREAAARAAEEARHKAAEALARAAAEEVITPLRLLGFRADEARRAAALCEAISDAPLEQRLRRALSCLQPRPRTPARAPTGLGSAP